MVPPEAEEGEGREVGEREKKRGSACHALSSLSPSPSLPPFPPSAPPPPASSTSLNLLLRFFSPPSPALFHLPRGRGEGGGGAQSSSVPQYVTTTRHTLLAGAQDNCPHYSYLKSAHRVRERAPPPPPPPPLRSSRRYKDAAERKLIEGDVSREERNMRTVARPRALRRWQLLISASGGQTCSASRAPYMRRCNKLDREDTRKIRISQNNGQPVALNPFSVLSPSEENIMIRRDVWKIILTFASHNFPR